MGRVLLLALAIASPVVLRAQEQRALRVGDGEFNIELDSAANIRALRLGSRTATPPTRYSFYELDGQLGDARLVSGGATPDFDVAAGPARARLTVSGGNGVRFHLETAAKQAGLVLTFPARTKFHLAEHKNIGRLLDQDMPVGQSFGAKLWYNFAIAEVDGMFIRLHADGKKWLNKSELHLMRHADSFTATFTWEPICDLRVMAFTSMDAALADYEAWMKREARVRELSERNLPGWARDIKVVVFADIMRSNGEIAHDFKDVMNLGKEIQKIRNPREVLLYLPGWQGPYDSTHPTYRPHPALGGAAGFKEMMDSVHSAGFRVLVHSTIWGIDPSHPQIDELEQAGAKWENGEFRGWMLPDKRLPRPAPMKFKTPPIPVAAPANSREFVLTTEAIPGQCEALITLGGVKPGKGRIRLATGLRNIVSPPGWFETHSEYAFPFALLLEGGVNKVKVTVEDAPGADWSGAWYQIRDTYHGGSPYASWTYPILMAKPDHPAFIQFHTESLRSSVREFGIDAVHMDAGSFYDPIDASKLFYKLRDELPGVVFGSEFYTTFEEMDYWHIGQAARQSLRDYNNILPCPCEQMALKPMSGVREMYAWLNKPSPICGFARKYILFYPHLCAANAFVPVGKVCNMAPARLIPPDKREHWETLRDAGKFDHIPGLRVNYRKYGLDEDTRRYLQER